MCLVIYINEASSKTQKKYKCPYCDYRDVRSQLISHIEEKHEELIPEGYTPSRIVFNLINHREHGVCMMDKKETQWDEDKERYDAFCCEKCKEEYVTMTRNRMMKVYGKETLLNDPEHQTKMLANRSISGTYKFTTGGVISYVGSYEQKFLEFMDKVLKIKTKDIIQNFPIIPYKHKNEDGSMDDHFFIPDYYYVPYNLVIDIKDGGDNPNNRDMQSYRQKQVEKEDAIRELKEYNYIRLTNNDFQQLILMFMELKELDSSVDNIKNVMIKINESAETAGCMIGADYTRAPMPDTIYFVLADKNHMFPRLGIARSKILDKMIFPNDAYKLEEVNTTYLKNSLYRIFEYTGIDVDYKYSKVLKDMKEGCICTEADLYKWFTGKDLLDLNQLFFDEAVSETTSYPEELKIMESSLIATLMSDDNIIPMIESSSVESLVEYAQDINGYFCYNKNTGFRSKSYDEISIIPDKVISYINKGFI